MKIRVEYRIPGRLVGCCPDYPQNDNLFGNNSIFRIETCWHQIIFLNFITFRPAGTVFTLRTAIAGRQRLRRPSRKKLLAAAFRRNQTTIQEHFGRKFGSDCWVCTPKSHGREHESDRQNNSGEAKKVHSQRAQPGRDHRGQCDCRDAWQF